MAGQSVVVCAESVALRFLRGVWDSMSLFLRRWLRWTIAVATCRCLIRFLIHLLNRHPELRARVWSVCASWYRTPVNLGSRARFQRAFALYFQGVREGHPHKEAATNRNSATVAMHATARALGCVPYVVSPSRREDDAMACRNYYQLNDFVQEVRNDPVPDNACIIMTDIDYYVDWKYWMSFERPVLIYTFVPECPGDTIPEGVFSMSDNVVESQVTGGGKYRHSLWDYNSDSAWVPTDGRKWYHVLLTYAGWAVGLWDHWRVTMFSIDQFVVGKHRRVISLVPYVVGPDWLVHDQAATQMRRLETQVVGSSGRKFNIMRVLKPDGPYVAVSRAGDPVSAVLKESRFIGTSIRYNKSTSKTLSDVVRYVGSDMTVDYSAILADYLSNVVEASMPTMQGAGTPAEHYLCSASNVVEDGKKYARRFAPKPLSVEAVFPLESHNNEEICLQKRLVEPQRKAAELIIQSTPRHKGLPPARFTTYASEFVDLVLGGKVGAGHPIFVDDVIERQNLPRQRERSMRRIMDVAEKFMVQAFQKKEAYSVPNDPRNISTCPTMHTLKLSSFTLAFKEDCLKHCAWYMPGKTPLEIAQAIMLLASENESLVEGDYSRFDGSISRWLRVNVEFPCYLRWIDPQYMVELNELLMSELDAKAFTKLGTKYSPMCSRLSGSPLTTDGNTLINAFIGFATVREFGADKAWAFEKSGVYYGDDSLMSGKVVHPTKQLGDLVRVASAVGLQLKAKEVHQHSPAMFLSRCFPDPWVSPDSMSDPLRALAKIHTTVDTFTDIQLCGFNKASAYLVTDAKTPVISNWCNAYLKALGKTFPETYAQDLPYWYVLPEHRAAPWPQDSIEDRVDLVAQSLSCRDDEIKAFMALLDNYSGTVDGLPQLGIADQRPKVACTVGGELRHPGESSLDTSDDGVSQPKPESVLQEHDAATREKDASTRSDGIPLRPKTTVSSSTVGDEYPSVCRGVGGSRKRLPTPRPSSPESGQIRNGFCRRSDPSDRADPQSGGRTNGQHTDGSSGYRTDVYGNGYWPRGRGYGRGRGGGRNEPNGRGRGGRPMRESGSGSNPSYSATFSRGGPP